MLGTITKSFSDRGYCFIAPDDAGADLFAHARNSDGGTLLPEGSRVEFEVRQHKNRPVAVNVRAIDAKPAFNLEEILADPAIREQARQILNSAECYELIDTPAVVEGGSNEQHRS